MLETVETRSTTVTQLYKPASATACNRVSATPVFSSRRKAILADPLPGAVETKSDRVRFSLTQPKPSGFLFEKTVSAMRSHSVRHNEK